MTEHRWDQRFGYTAVEYTYMDVFQRTVTAGERISLPQGGFTGCILLFPAEP